MTEVNEEWEKKYLRKRISSFSKISVNITEMNEIFVKKTSAKVDANDLKLDSQKKDRFHQNKLQCRDSA